MLRRKGVGLHYHRWPWFAVITASGNGNDIATLHRSSSNPSANRLGSGVRHNQPQLAQPALAPSLTHRLHSLGCLCPAEKLLRNAVHRNALQTRATSGITGGRDTGYTVFQSGAIPGGNRLTAPMDAAHRQCYFLIHSLWSFITQG